MWWCFLYCFFVVFSSVVEIYWIRIVIKVLKSYVNTELRLSWVCPIAFRGVLAKRDSEICVWPVLPPDCLSPAALPTPVYSSQYGHYCGRSMLCDQDAVHIPNHLLGVAFLEIARNLLPSWLCHSSRTLGRHWAWVIQIFYRDFDVCVLKTSKPPFQVLIEHGSGKLCGWSPSMIFWGCSTCRRLDSKRWSVKRN